MPDVGEFAPGKIDYDRQSTGYTAGRSLSEEAAAAWAEAIARHLAADEVDTVLDLGSGSGRFSPLLAEALDARVVGVEPSRGMREAALRDADHEQVDYVAGDGRWVPLADSSCDVAWMCHVIHHVPDRPAFVREVGRVVRASGKVLLVGGFPGRMDDLTMFRFFPEAKLVLEQFPAVEEVVSLFEAAGFAHEAIERVTRQSCASLAELAQRAGTRADTTLELISDRAFDRGMAMLRRAAEAETTPAPVIDSLDLLVFVNG